MFFKNTVLGKIVDFNKADIILLDKPQNICFIEAGVPSKIAAVQKVQKLQSTKQ